MQCTTIAASAPVSSETDRITLFLCGDVMTGRGIDQVLPHPSDPVLHEPYMRSAVGYVELAEAKSGPIPRLAGFSYIWGDALPEWTRAAPDVRIVNLETGITTSPEYWPSKGIHYRMHPRNLPCLTAAGIDCCALANNHVLDWGRAGLDETLTTLHAANIKTAGAGRMRAEAEQPAIMDVPGKGRVLVYACGFESSGIPREWAATEDRAGVNLKDASGQTVLSLEETISRTRRPGDLVVASLHWGSNWGYTISRHQTALAHRLVDEAGVDLVHGHSSHHAQGIEIYNGKPVIYGCGDFINDYEGIGGYEAYRDDLVLMYFVSMNVASGVLVALHMVPMQIKNFRLRRASSADAAWLQDVLNKEGARWGTRVERGADGALALQWEQRRLMSTNR